MVDMADFADKFEDPRWKRKRDDLLSRRNYECEDCGELHRDAQVHICYYTKGRKLWEYPDRAYKCYCPRHRIMRQRVEDDLKEILADFSIDELDSLHLALKEFAAIRNGRRERVMEQLYADAKAERSKHDFIYEDEEDEY